MHVEATTNKMTRRRGYSMVQSKDKDKERLEGYIPTAKPKTGKVERRARGRKVEEED